VLGPLTSEQNALFLRNPRFAGLKFPDMSRPETLQKKYVGVMSKRALNFCRSLMQMDPQTRLTTSHCVEHPYFEDLPDYQKRTVQELPTRALPIEQPSRPAAHKMPAMGAVGMPPSRMDGMNRMDGEGTGWKDSPNPAPPLQGKAGGGGGRFRTGQHVAASSNAAPREGNALREITPPIGNRQGQHMALGQPIKIEDGRKSKKEKKRSDKVSNNYTTGRPKNGPY
jgi:hypothetical protein